MKNNSPSGKRRKSRRKVSTLKKMLWSAAGKMALNGLYFGRLHTDWLQIERCPMPLTGLGKGFEGATVAHISDLHRSPIVLERYLRNCVEAVNDLEVDFVAITGDFITGTKRYARGIGNVLKDLRPNIASVACLGNHDYGLVHPSGLGRMKGLAGYLTEQLTAAGVYVMLNETTLFHRGGSAVQFVGVEDFWSRKYDPHAAFAHARQQVPTIALCHNPDGAPDMISRGAQWVLAGHTHGRPAKKRAVKHLFFPKRHKHFAVGHYEVGDGRLYVNRGLGHGLRHSKLRPEITLFTLSAKADHKTLPVPNIDAAG